MDVSANNLFEVFINSSLFDVYTNQRTKLLEDTVKKIMFQEYKLKKLDGPPEDPEIFRKLGTMEDQNRQLLKEEMADAHNNRYFFITINPPPTTKLVEFRKKVEKYVERKLCVKYLYAYEQRAVDVSSAGQGFHCHMLIERNLNYKPCKFCDNTRNTFKSLFKNNGHLSQSTLNIIPCPREYLKDKKEYFLGLNKTGEGKEEKQFIDILWREKNKLDPYYGDLDFA